MASSRSSTMSAVWFLDTPVLAEISSTRSALVIPIPPIGSKSREPRSDGRFRVHFVDHAHDHRADGPSGPGQHLRRRVALVHDEHPVALARVDCVEREQRAAARAARGVLFIDEQELGPFEGRMLDRRDDVADHARDAQGQNPSRYFPVTGSAFSIRSTSTTMAASAGLNASAMACAASRPLTKNTRWP